jgi:hypothetical protein
MAKHGAPNELSNERDILGRVPVANMIICNDRRQYCEAVTSSSPCAINYGNYISATRWYPWYWFTVILLFFFSSLYERGIENYLAWISWERNERRSRRIYVRLDGSSDDSTLAELAFWRKLVNNVDGICLLTIDCQNVRIPSCLQLLGKDFFHGDIWSAIFNRPNGILIVTIVCTA